MMICSRSLKAGEEASASSLNQQGINAGEKKQIVKRDSQKSSDTNVVKQPDSNSNFSQSDALNSTQSSETNSNLIKSESRETNMLISQQSVIQTAKSDRTKKKPKVDSTKTTIDNKARSGMASPAVRPSKIPRSNVKREGNSKGKTLNISFSQPSERSQGKQPITSPARKSPAEAGKAKDLKMSFLFTSLPELEQ